VVTYLKSAYSDIIYEPCSIAVDKNNNYYVGDTHLNKVFKITPNGKILRCNDWPKLLRTGDVLDIGGDFECPAAMCADSLGNVYVANCLKHNITKISTDGMK
jgi:DNA-binding beta-propeller fold protein YncE